MQARPLGAAAAPGGVAPECLVRSASGKGRGSPSPSLLSKQRESEKKALEKKGAPCSEHKGKCKFGWAGESFQYKHRTCMGRLLDAVKNWRQVCTAGGGLRSAAPLVSFSCHPHSALDT
jgi:hypothetical protein